MRLDRNATAISLLVVVGVPADGQLVLLADKATGREHPRRGAVLDDLPAATCGAVSFLVVDRARDGGRDRRHRRMWASASTRTSSPMTPT
jgi:hypothetical protein